MGEENLAQMSHALSILGRDNLQHHVAWFEFIGFLSTGK